MLKIRKMNALEMARRFIELAGYCTGNARSSYLNAAKAEIARARAIVEGMA